MDFLRARYDRAELWLNEALDCGRRVTGRDGQGRDLPGFGAQRTADYPQAIALLGMADALVPGGR